MRISDWSSDVCSSDLAGARAGNHPDGARQRQRAQRADADPAAGSRRRPAGGAGGGQYPARADCRAVVRQPAAADAAESVRGGNSGFGIRDSKKRSEEHTSELQSLMRISYAVFCLKKKKTTQNTITSHTRIT